MSTMTVPATVPEQRTAKDPDAPWKGQAKYAAGLMRRLWGHDPETCEELTEGLYTMGRAQLGRVVDNLMWTLANQPRLINAEQERYIRALWARKMSKPIDAAFEARLASMDEVTAQRLVYRLQAEPDLATRAPSKKV